MRAVILLAIFASWLWGVVFSELETGTKIFLSIVTIFMLSKVNRGGE